MLDLEDWQFLNIFLKFTSIHWSKQQEEDSGLLYHWVWLQDQV
jgi:hypothetical protein